MTSTQAELQHAADALCRDARFRDVLERDCTAIEPLADTLNMRIHAGDHPSAKRSSK